jgi:hypothetical protein
MGTVLLLPAKRLLAFATNSDLGVLLPLQRQLDVRYWPLTAAPVSDSRGSFRG